MIAIGVDVGSISTKAAAVKDGKLVAKHLIMTGYNAAKAARTVYEGILAELGVNSASISNIVATGYGRNSVEFAKRMVTEITCHAAGAYYLNSKIRSVIDIGGQDSKAIVLDETGRVKDFVMNDKCAAGTGRFLEVMARALEVDLDDFGDISLQSRNPASISSLCTVFAESEVISLIAKGEMRENIIAGIHDSIVARIVAMANRIGLTGSVMITGGVAKNIGVIRALENKISKPIEVSESAQIAGAIGAAMIAMKSVLEIS
jgi:predicted CoA-substrate-specific enzyme activase